MKYLFLTQIPNGSTTLGFRIYKVLKEQTDRVLSEELYLIVRAMPNSHRFKGKILGLHYKRLELPRSTTFNYYSLGGRDDIQKFHF